MNKLKNYQKAFVRHRSEIDSINNEIQLLRKQLFERINDADFKETTFLNTLGELEQEKAHNTLIHFKEVRNFLTEEQKVKFDALIKRALPPMSPPGNMKRRPPH